MKTRLLTAITIGMLALGAAAVVAQSGNDLLQQALVKERTDGNMPAAIALYQTIIQKYPADRALVAKALVQMGQCYEKLGQRDALKVYERVVREFADQPESAAAARTQLASMQRASAAGSDMSFRRVSDSSQNEYGVAVSYDGRYLSHHLHPDALGTIAVRELATGRVHTLVRSPEAGIHPDYTVMSRDSKMVAYTWITAEGRCELRTIPLETSSPGQPRRLFYSGDVEYVVPFDWSPDGTQIAVGLEHRDGPRIGLVSAIDGSLRVLKSARGDPSKMFFSPDGRNLAYDLPADGNAGQRDVFVMAVDGSRDVAAVAHPSNDTLAGWSPDGKHLLFLSDRAGSRGLWNQPVVDGKPQDAAVPIKADLGSSSHSFGITASGSLYVRTRLQGENEIWVLENFLPKTAAVR